MACVRTLKITYEKQTWSIFKFHDNIVAPIRILKILGVDVFKDMRFDSWALQTHILRIENNMINNREGGVVSSAICPLFCMFNHDCDPSAKWSAYHQGGPVSVVAERDIKEGEEISVSYIIDTPLERDRRPKLTAQIGSMCGCARCYNERRAALEEEAPPTLELLRLMNEVSNRRGDPSNEILRCLRDQYFSV